MKFLLDTNITLWYILEDDRLPVDIRKAIMDENNHVSVSVASLWEIGIKHSIGKLKLEGELARLFYDIEHVRSLSTIEIKPEHVIKVSVLPFHHRDPFDRLIWAQSVCENLTLLYTDKIFDRYRSS